jgi:hypothetical protein
MLRLHPKLSGLNVLALDMFDVYASGVQLPRLKSLHLGLYWREDIGMIGTITLVTLLHDIRDSLVTLALHGYRLASYDISKVLNGLAEMRKLRTLSLQLEFLSPQILDLLAVKLPLLDDLRFLVNGYASVNPKNYQDPYDTNEDLVCELLRQLGESMAEYFRVVLR